jgi:hypothetical protein
VFVLNSERCRRTPTGKISLVSPYGNRLICTSLCHSATPLMGRVSPVTLTPYFSYDRDGDLTKFHGLRTSRLPMRYSWVREKLTNIPFSNGDHEITVVDTTARARIILTPPPQSRPATGGKRRPIGFPRIPPWL